jgi:hypothetical protein
MDIDIAGLVEFAFAATSVGALAYKRPADVLQRPHIEDSVQSRGSIGDVSCWRLLLTNFAVPARKNFAISAVMLAMTLGGCAHNRTPPDSGMVRQETRATSVRATAPAVRYSARPAPSAIRRVTRALLVPQAAPDCEFKEPDPKPVDADQWARLKLEYERQCYKNAEQAVRKRLTLLQASNRCEVVPVGHRQAAQDAPGKQEVILRNRPR